MDYFAPPRAKATKRHTTNWGAANTAPQVLRSNWEPFQEDKVRDRETGHVVVFATSAMRDRWLLAQHPTLHSRRKQQNTTIAMREGKGLL